MEIKYSTMITTIDYKFFKPINQVLNHRIVCITIRYSFYKTWMKNISTHQLTAQTQRYMLFRNTLILFCFFFTERYEQHITCLK